MRCFPPTPRRLDPRRSSRMSQVFETGFQTTGPRLRQVRRLREVRATRRRRTCLVGPRRSLVRCFHLVRAAAALLGCVLAGPATADGAVQVVASIKPVHSLVSAVMAGVGEPHLIMRDGMSHHSFNMRPSDAAVLQEARLIFLIDESMEAGLADAIGTLAPDARVIALSGAEGLIRRPMREGGAFEADPFHEHEGHGDAGQGDEGQGDEGQGGESQGGEGQGGEGQGGEGQGDEGQGGEGRGNEVHGDGHGHDHDHAHGHGHGHYHGHGHVHGPFDLHIWLDPVNATAMAHMIAETLSEADPANADTYEDNMYELVHRLEYLTADLGVETAPVRGRPFIVFHDGYRYFEDRFGLTAAGSAVVSPERSPGVRRIRELREKVRELGVVCVIDEPQFDRRLVNTVVEGTSVRAGTVDPMGATVENGPELYFTVLRKMAATFTECLAAPG